MGTLWDWRGPQTAFLVSAVLGASAALLLMLMVKTHASASLSTTVE
jgi:hypothetical protein